jgi:uncharacterized Zn finger protein
MRSSRIISIIVICAFLTACGSTTKTTPLNIHTANNAAGVKINEGEQYKIVLVDGREALAEGNTIQVRSDAIYVYSTQNERWDRFERSEVKDVYLVKTDTQKRSKKRAYITGAAVLAAFAAALTGGYFLEKKMK